MNNAEIILSALDAKLDGPVELTLYGRAALALGFNNSPPDYFQSKDVDAVLWIHQAEELLATTNFWQAVQELNEEFGDQGLYISHLFEETQVILTSQWKEQRVRIEGPWKRLTVYRLGDEDLFLSKLMRDDPQDFGDAKFIAKNAGWKDEEIASLVASARVPPIPDLRNEFAHTAKQFLKQAGKIKDPVVLESAVIGAVAYNRQDRTMDMNFRGGGSYRYFGVPIQTYRDLLRAESAGAFWNEVKDDFAYVKLD